MLFAKRASASAALVHACVRRIAIRHSGREASRVGRGAAAKVVDPIAGPDAPGSDPGGALFVVHLGRRVCAHLPVAVHGGV